MFILDELTKEESQRQFWEQCTRRIQFEAKMLVKNDRVCEILSGAAYNIGYGRYVAAGGGRLISELLAKMGKELSRLDPAILRPIHRLKELGLWRPRSDSPNELAYYQAVHSFAVENHAQVDP
jgi:hypothetical protein